MARADLRAASTIQREAFDRVVVEVGGAFVRQWWLATTPKVTAAEAGDGG